MNNLKPCPFCDGRAAVSFKDAGFGGQNYNGDKRLKYRVQVICNKCHARGKPITTDWIVNANPYITRFYLEQTKARARWLQDEYSAKQIEMTKTFEPYVKQAIDAWNRRQNNDTEST